MFIDTLALYYDADDGMHSTRCFFSKMDTQASPAMLSVCCSHVTTLGLSLYIILFIEQRNVIMYVALLQVDSSRSVRVTSLILTLKH
jgi:hypothetical protein